MKRIIYLLITVIFITGCDKMIDIEYNTNVKESTPKSFWEGIWDGTLTSLDEKYEYGCTLTITKYTEKSIKGTLKIYSLPEKNDFIIYDLKITNNKNFLKIETIDRIKEKGSISFCDESTFNLELSEDKKSLTGFGRSQGDCLITDSKVNIEKQ